MSEISFEFATQDDCLQKMVPSDLRAIISERDWLREKNTELLDVLSYALDVSSEGLPLGKNWQATARSAIAKAKGAQE